MRRIFLIYHVVLTECRIKYVEESQTGRMSRNWSRAANSLGEISLPVRGAVDRRAYHYSETDRRRLASNLWRLRRHRGVILSGGPQERRNHRTRVCGSPLLLQRQGPRTRLWPSLQPNGSVSRATPVP